METKSIVASVFCPAKSAWSPTQRSRLVAGLKELRRGGLDIGPGKVTTKRVRRQDWAESWKRHFKPIQIGGSLLIKPSWSKRCPRKRQAVVVLDPGLSFGTGQHPTTAFCLEQLVGFRRKEQSQSFLDLGTGSGILAIAAAKLDYAPVHAIDFDPEAIRVASANARQNGVLKQLELSRQDLTKLPVSSRRKYDLICANLISNLLLAEGPRLLNRLQKNGRLVLAGILKPEFAVVRTAYEKMGLRLVAHRIENEWQSGAFVFKV
jgi:ribosomal protein L11 methyltransferase